MRDLIELLKAFGLFVSCLVIGNHKIKKPAPLGVIPNSTGNRLPLIN